jgi:hypothetical protein
MYKSLIKNGAMIAIALAISACASTGDRNPDSTQEEDVEFQHEKYDGREPRALQGDFTWLNEVEDEFGRISSRTSSRTVASQTKQEVLMKNNDWAFGFMPKGNHFFVEAQGASYKMVQARISDGERFAFAAEGLGENPVIFSVARGEGRNVASGTVCDTEISFWNKRTNRYVTERRSVGGERCARMLSVLKDYVP